MIFFVKRGKIAEKLKRNTIFSPKEMGGNSRFKSTSRFQLETEEAERLQRMVIAQKDVCRSAYSELRRISTIRHLLSVDSTKTLVSVFVLSGCPKHLLEKLQKVQNTAARLVLKAHKRDHVSPLLRTLHWLPIQARIEYKLLTLCHSFCL